MVELAALSALAAGTFFSLRGDGNHGFWAGHPMLGSLVSGVLMLGFGVVFLDRILKRRDLGRWRQVSHLACHTLGDQVTRGIVTGLAVLWTDDAHLAKPRYEARLNWNTANLDPIDEINEVPAGRDAVALLQDPTLPRIDERPTLAHVPRGRLIALLGDATWRAWAIPYLREIRTRGRDLVAQWAPVMIMAEEPRALLNRVAQLNDDLGVLRERIERVSERAIRGVETEGADLVVIVNAWADLDQDARVLTNELWAMAGQSHYSFAA